MSIYFQLSKFADYGSSYYSIGHDRKNIGNILLWEHDGQKIHTKRPERPTQTHLSAFGPIDGPAKGRIELDKKISSFMFFPIEGKSNIETNTEYRKIIRDLKSQFPDILFLSNGKPIDERDAFAANYYNLIKLSTNCLDEKFLQKIAYDSTKTLSCVRFIQLLRQFAQQTDAPLNILEKKIGNNKVYTIQYKNREKSIVCGESEEEFQQLIESFYQEEIAKNNNKFLDVQQKQNIRKIIEENLAEQLQDQISMDVLVNILNALQLQIVNGKIQDISTSTTEKPAKKSKVYELTDLPKTISSADVGRALLYLGLIEGSTKGDHRHFNNLRPTSTKNEAACTLNKDKQYFWAKTDCKEQCKQCEIHESDFVAAYYRDKNVRNKYKISQAKSASNYFNLQKFAQFGAGYGEWWIDESGQTMYADIDIGDKGHEMFVIEHAQSMIIPAEYHSYSENPWQDFTYSLAEDLLDEAHANKNLKTHIEKYVGNDLASIDAKELIDQGYIEDYILKKFKPNKQLMDIAMGRGDVRLFGVKEFGWKRVMNKFVETWFFRPQDCALISRGLGDIAQDDEEGTTQWTIEVRSANKVYPNIPLMVIEKGPVAVSNYARKQEDVV